MRNNSKSAGEGVTGKVTTGLDLENKYSYYYTLDATGENVESGFTVGAPGVGRFRA